MATPCVLTIIFIGARGESNYGFFGQSSYINIANKGRPGDECRSVDYDLSRLVPDFRNCRGRSIDEEAAASRLLDDGRIPVSTAVAGSPVLAPRPVQANRARPGIRRQSRPLLAARAPQSRRSPDSFGCCRRQTIDERVPRGCPVSRAAMTPRHKLSSAPYFGIGRKGFKTGK
jgi:hypothetical protein